MRLHPTQQEPRRTQAVPFTRTRPLQPPSSPQHLLHVALRSMQPKEEFPAEAAFGAVAAFELQPALQCAARPGPPHGPPSPPPSQRPGSPVDDEGDGELTSSPTTHAAMARKRPREAAEGTLKLPAAVGDWSSKLHRKTLEALAWGVGSGWYARRSGPGRSRKISRVGSERAASLRRAATSSSGAWRRRGHVRG